MKNKEDLERRVKDALQLALADVAYDTRESTFSGELKFSVKRGWSEITSITIK